MPLQVVAETQDRSVVDVEATSWYSEDVHVVTSEQSRSDVDVPETS